ncbi:uncharacterized protein AC631_01796 [Debaryomyces fabryi]|uniref:Uncharacterized protein n=1 Tax=Debaryomyces fabryi TaxID=58627 RepID=A0A0V1Q1N6_9ASCO|nr:uncharacterized protein AC631_01796 [Debaryomyces fabryi]KSA02427.1 hypothetical protein AC631_01796 [Debaryomyces fabryi]CUM54779.1 unnamed protein product [Debaryomyces fabryi]
MTEVSKENVYSLRTINKRKSYSILSPVNQRTIDITANKNERIISESTGLVKFSLSPNKGEEENISNTPTKSKGKTGLPVYVPINEAIIEQNESSQEDLMIQFASKQRKLIELEKQVEVTKFELAEIASKIEKDIEQPKEETNMSNFNNLNNLKKRASNIFLINQGNVNNKTHHNFNSSKSPGTISPVKKTKSINNFSNYFTKVQDQISQTQLNAPVLKSFVKDVRSRIEINDNEKLKTFLATQQNEFDEFTSKTSKFVNGLFNNRSSKEDTDKEEMANSSFNFEAMEDFNNRSILDANVSLSEEENITFEEGMVDIDDYNSSFEEETANK